MENTNTKVPYGIGQDEFDAVQELEVRINKLKSLLLNSNYGNWNYDQKLEDAEVETLLQMEKVTELITGDLSDHAKEYRLGFVYKNNKQ